MIKAICTHLQQQRVCTLSFENVSNWCDKKSKTKITEIMSPYTNQLTSFAEESHPCKFVYDKFRDQMEFRKWNQIFDKKYFLCDLIVPGFDWEFHSLITNLHFSTVHDIHFFEKDILRILKSENPFDYTDENKCLFISSNQRIYINKGMSNTLLILIFTIN